MVALVLRIVLRSLATLFLLTAVVFFALHLTGDPARIMLGDGADATALAAFRAQWGLDKPLWEQFVIYLQKFLTLDMGRSYLTGLPVKDVFLNAFWPTLDLMIPTAIVTLLIGIPAGVIAALNRNTAIDRGMMFISVFGYAVPNFFMGVLLLLIFSIWLGWLPSYGNTTIWHYIMPIITMATSEAAIFSRYARSAMIDALRMPCVKAAQMRGLPKRRIIWLHALPNAMLSILTIMGFFLGTLVAGAVITENVFSWPGVGKLLVQSVANRDIPVVQLIVLATGASLIIANLAMDLLALVVNPRLRKSNN
jgi:ABC-type dipeptide/oligopeptide/nickel transport system permease component